MDIKPEPKPEDGNFERQSSQNSEAVFNQFEEKSLTEIFAFLAKEYTWKFWKVNLKMIARDVGINKYTLLWILIIIK